jgi:hypothetical protein
MVTQRRTIGMDPVRRPVVVPAATQVTCDLGHVVCVTARAIRAGEPLALEMFTQWQSGAPRIGEEFPRCKVCGGAAHRQNADEVELHTPEGWRSLKGAAHNEVATKGDVAEAAAHVRAEIDASVQRIERLLWKHTIGIILNVLVIGAILVWLAR